MVRLKVVRTLVYKKSSEWASRSCVPINDPNVRCVDDACNVTELVECHDSLILEGRHQCSVGQNPQLDEQLAIGKLGLAVLYGLGIEPLDEDAEHLLADIGECHAATVRLLEVSSECCPEERRMVTDDVFMDDEGLTDMNCHDAVRLANNCQPLNLMLWSSWYRLSVAVKSWT